MLRRLPARCLSKAALAALACVVVAGGARAAPNAAVGRSPSGGSIVQPARPDPIRPTGAPAPVTLEALVQAALVDAAAVSGLPLSSLEVLDAAAVEWPDGAGGCPEPGVVYTQAQVPGFRIRIRAGKQVLNYHATRLSQRPQRCPADRVQPALPPRGGVA